MKNKRIFLVFLASLLLLAVTVCWEYVFDRQDEDVWVRRFEKRLHAKELQADKLLFSLTDSSEIEQYDKDEDLVFVGFKDGQLTFWTDEIIGEEGLYTKISGTGNFVRINNVFYEVRRGTPGNTEFYGLIRIKDDYPYNSPSVKNEFAGFFRIGEENADNIQVNRFATESERVVRDKGGNQLFYILHTKDYKDRSANYFLLALYLLFFFSLFYVYDRLLAQARSLKEQFICIGGFILFLILLRFLLVYYRVPDSLFRLYLFDNITTADTFVMSVGDILMSAFCVCQVLYISFTNIKINYQGERLKRYRYVFVCGFVLLVGLYLSFLNFGVNSLVEHTDVHLNIARIIYVGAPSILAFVAIILIGIGLIVIIDSSAVFFKNFLSLWFVVRIVSVIMLLLAVFSWVFDLYTTFWDCVFWLGLYLLILVNRYIVPKDVQRSMFMISMFLLSAYIVVLAKKTEQYRELTQRLEYATELIEERDYSFEQKLERISEQIQESEVIADLIAENDKEMLQSCLTSDMLDMTGYNYSSDILLCYEKDSISPGTGERAEECAPYFNLLIIDKGIRIGQSNFYSVSEFDGQISYIGKFVSGKGILFLRFDSVRDSEGGGYSEILSRKPDRTEDIVYSYSYAKYKDGELVFSSGEFNYYRFFGAFGLYSENIDIVEKDNYSHMLIPVEGGGMLVISLHDAFFSLYFMNVLYVFFVCILIASYGLFFSLNHSFNFRRGTLKSRIKNSFVSLIFILFVILTAMSIYLNTRSFEERHNAKASEYLKFINKELENLDCVDVQKCPAINDILARIAQVLKVDVNIYSGQGILVATSRPEIFNAGFDGYLLNPRALKKIMKEGGMSYVEQEKVCELGYMGAYMPLVLKNGDTYVLNVPYFTQNDELNLDTIIMVVIAINIAIVVMVLAFVLSGIVAERVTKPLQMLNDKLKQMRFGGKNEKIAYNNRDEVGALVKEYNNMVEKLDESIEKLARSERENAWREMARQIAHEIKNPLTPMKLNIQFMQRSLLIENPDEFRKRFKDISGVLIEQIDNMASIASAFSDFAKMPVANCEVFDISEMLANCSKLFEKNIGRIYNDIEPGITVNADREQIQRVFVNVLKNAEQSIPEDRQGIIHLIVKREQFRVVIRIRDNGVGIPDDLKHKIFEPNFTTKSGGTGLGLAISRKIVESMGGTIDFVSTVNEGTEFFVYLDCVQ